MTAPLVAFAIYDDTGAPLTSATPVLTVYKARTGTNLTPPAISHLGGGLYGFSPTQTDANSGLGYLVTTGANPERLAGAFASDRDLVVFALYDSTGAPASGATPTFASYVDSSGNALAQPSITNLGGGLYGFTVTEAHLALRVAYEVTCGAGVVPARLGGGVSEDGDLVAVALYSEAGAVLTGATPTVASYRDRTGSSQSAPAVTALGGGLYGLVATPTDITEGRAYEVTAGQAAVPDRWAGAVSELWDLVAFGVYDSAGAPTAAVTPTISSYRDRSGNSRAAPTVLNLGGGLYGFVPTSVDLADGVAYEILTNAYPARVSGWVMEPPGSTVDIPVVLLAHWRCDDTSLGTMLDDLDTHPLTVAGSAPLVTGQVGTARRFRKSSTSTDVPAVIATGTPNSTLRAAFQSEFTVALRVRQPARETGIYAHPSGDGNTWYDLLFGLTGDDSLVVPEDTTENPLFRMHLSSLTGHIGAVWEGAGGTNMLLNYSSNLSAPNATIEAGLWHHVAITATREAPASTCTVTIYINGVAAGSRSGRVFPFDGSNNSIMVGGIISDVGGSESRVCALSADVDDIRVYSGAMTAAEVLALAMVSGQRIERLELSVTHTAVSLTSGKPTRAELTSGAPTRAEVSRG